MIEFIPLQKYHAEMIMISWGNRAENFTYLSSVVFSSKELAQEYINNIIANPRNLAFNISVNGKTIGLVKATIRDNQAQVGYVIDKNYWGNGYATAAVEYITNLLSEQKGIQRIWATCALQNAGSIRVLEKCGYQNEGALKNWIIYPLQGNVAQDNYSFTWKVAQKS